MKLSLNWLNAKHFLLQNPSVTLEVDGTAIAGTLSVGGAAFVFTGGLTATLTVKFAPAFAGGPRETLRVVQHFSLIAPLPGGGGGAIATSFTVRPTGAAADVTLLGAHPLVRNMSALGFWHVMIDTNTVDVTTVQPLIFNLQNLLSRPATRANVRVLARTDGKLPLHWVTATPSASTAFASTDVLCFLTPPQKSTADSDKPTLLTHPAEFAGLAARLAIFLSGGKHDDTFPARGRDHFARARNASDAGWPNQPVPNTVLPRSWESALVSSGRHVTLAMPVPSGSSHNAAATAALPSLLSDVHATLVAVGDIASPSNSALSPPLLGVAAHSNGGAALFSAVDASPKAFREVWLFDTNDTGPALAMLARATTANVLFAGFDAGRVVAAHAVAAGMPSLSGRIRRLPNPVPANNATPAALAASSSTLTHALEGGAVATPASSWTPGVVPMPLTGETFVERFEVLHQQIVQGNDADGRHYLTKALASSAFR